MAKKIIGWSLMVLTIIGLSVVIGLNGKYIFTKDKYYSQKEVDAKVEEAFNNGVNSNTDLLESILFYKNECDKYKANIESLNAELEAQKNETLKVQYDLAVANESKTAFASQVVSLEKQISDNELVINQNEAEIERLQAQITALEETGDIDSAEIVRLNATINSLRQTNASLQETNANNLETISSLNAQITTLNTRIADLNTTQTENLATISQLNTKISQLNSSISYYETYLKTLESEENVILTFEYDGSVYNIQVVSIGSSVSITTPADTERLKFNGWKNEAGETVDFATYTATKTEKFTADLIVYHKVDFVAFGEVVGTTYVEHGERLNEPSLSVTVPNDGFSYSLIGYSTDNVNLNVYFSDTNYLAISEDKTIYLMYLKNVHVRLYNCKYGTTDFSESVGNNLFINCKYYIKETDYKKFKNFTFKDGSIMSEDFVVPDNPTLIEIYANYTYFYDVTYEIDGTIDTSRSQIVEENTFASTSAVASTDRHVFEGWYVDDVKVDISTYAITKTTKFVAKFIDKVQAKFIVDGEQYGDIQYVVVNGKVVKPENPTKEGYTFNGWSIDGTTTVDFDNITISTDIVFTALFSENIPDGDGGNTRPGQREDDYSGSDYDN